MMPKRYVKPVALRISRKGFFLVFMLLFTLQVDAFAEIQTAGLRDSFQDLTMDTVPGITEYDKINRLDFRLLDWIAGNRTADTDMPLSFGFLPGQESTVFKNMGESGSVEGIIERVIVKEGLVIYDGAVAQIALNLSHRSGDMEQARRPFEIYWNGRLNETNSIRAGYPINRFVYDTQSPELVSSNLNHKGKRGFIFRIINAHGKYLTEDPLDGKDEFHAFPNYSAIHWEDWKPVAGENAWVAMAALHVYHRLYFNPLTGVYDHPDSSIELELAEELARAAMLLIAENGGVRMAPLGTFRNERDFISPEQKQGEWWYQQISSENNLSWYGAFRMLHEVTGKAEYMEAMRGIEDFFKSVWNDDLNYFYQGTAYSGGRWKVNDADFALDVQTWGILTFGPEKIDSWFGEGKSYDMWEVSKLMSGYWVDGEIAGVGYTQEHDRLSVEWTAGAIMAARKLADYYRGSGRAQLAELAAEDAEFMRKNIDMLRYEVSEGKQAYSYSSRRGWIPFGWNSHDPQVLSVASTGWMIFVDTEFNPFWLNGDDTQGPFKNEIAGR